MNGKGKDIEERGKREYKRRCKRVEGNKDERREQ